MHATAPLLQQSTHQMCSIGQDFQPTTVKAGPMFPHLCLINNPPDDPVPVIRDVDQQAREIHAGELRADLILGKRSK